MFLFDDKIIIIATFILERRAHFYLITAKLKISLLYKDAVNCLPSEFTRNRQLLIGNYNPYSKIITESASRGHEFQGFLLGDVTKAYSIVERARKERSFQIKHTKSK